MDKKALYNLSYGVFVVSTKYEDIVNGCITNTCIQVANDPTRVMISVINKNYTCELIKKSQVFNVCVLDNTVKFDTIKHFGYQSGRDVKKYEAVEYATDLNGIPYIQKETNALICCKVVASTDLGSHTVFTGEIVDMQVLSKNPSLTYAMYQSDVKPKPVKKADNREIVGWRCKICNYVYEGAVLPDDYTCPLCGHDKSDFEPIYKEEEKEQPKEEKKEDKITTKWICSVCGYIYEGEELPEDFKCPVCKVGADQFKKVEGELTLAAEHEFGIYGKTVKNNPDISEEDKKYIFDQLKANFEGECSEVGMYLCMARVAHREGYPEIGLYWEKAAHEEAEHAAKFAEMLGEDLEPNMKASTKENLRWRVDCEFGATAGKVDLAKCAKKNGLDAIHDTVHEMARDEARHGRALKGLLERYFK